MPTWSQQVFAIGWVVSFTGYKKFLDSGSVIKVVVACIPRGGSSCDEKNPEVVYLTTNEWKASDPLG